MYKRWFIRSLWVVAIALFLSPFLLIGAWIIGVSWSESHPEIGMNVAAVEWLPQSASSVSFHKQYSYTAYEFTITEEDFLVWLDEKTPIEIDEPVEMLRYNFIIEYFPTPENTKTISSGLYWQTPPRGNGGGTSIAFDRNTGIAYFQSNPR